MADPLTIECSGLRKQYGHVDALRGLDLQVPKGSIFGFLGRNGAGKTTLIKVLLGMARATSGTARVFDLAVDTPATSVEIRRRTGFVSEDKDLYDYMTVAEIIHFTAGFVAPYGIFHLMRADSYFYSARVPWLTLLFAAALTTVLIHRAVLAVERRDF